jgi:hypothetical protein
MKANRSSQRTVKSFALPPAEFNVANDRCCGNQDKRTDPVHGRFVAHSSRLANQNISNQ